MLSIVTPRRTGHNGGRGNRAIEIFRRNQVEARDMRKLLLSLLVVLPVAAQGQTRIDAMNTNFRWLGPDDKIVVDRYDDPKVANVSCYLSRAETGGIKGGLGLAEDPSRFSIACRAVGPITIPSGLPKREVIGFASASLFFKTFQIHRSVDVEKNVLIYTVISTKLINGSPFNSISVVPVNAP
jgi:CreA protein